ncbi:MAG: hypothetical protein V9G98_25880 [Candidatus Competibacter sp.]
MVSVSPDHYNHLIFNILSFTAREVGVLFRAILGVSTLMHIEAELNEIHAERLLRLQQQRQKPLAEVVAEILADAIDHAIETETQQPETESQRIYRVFEEAGLIGCFEGEGNLSVEYKKYLWGNDQ